MKIEVYIRQTVYCISCGVGAQKIRWLAQAAALKYDPNSMLKTGEPRVAKLEDGTILNMNDRISQRLVDNARIWIYFEDLTQPPEKKKDPKKK